MANILQAIYNISQLHSYAIVEQYKNSIRIQQAGDSLEYFIKDAFCNGFNQSTLIEKEKLYRQCFSYLGNANNPPDLMIKNGDAIEVKKIEGIKSAIALNSSYPKNKIYSDSRMITKECRECESWGEKDIIYAIGTVAKKELRALWLVYGSVYAAEKTVYERVNNAISAGIKNISDIDLSTTTKELGGVKKVDPLGITYLRIRGMWGIEHPIKVFQQIVTPEKNIVNAVIARDKYLSFPKLDIARLEKEQSISIKEIDVKNPNNPAKTINAIHIAVRGKQ